MREIKFRAFDDGKMIYEKNILHLSNEDNLILRLAKFWSNIRNDSHIMQFTGLRDKNGKEIFSGDIVKIYDIHPWKKINHEIVFDDGAFCIKPQGQHRMTSFILFADQMEHYRGHRNIGQFIEIIGNIWENPELLK